MKISAFFRRLAVCALGVSCAGAASAASRVWQGTSGGSWSDATRWSGGEVPTSEDTAQFNYDLDCGKIALSEDTSVAELRVNAAWSVNKSWVLNEFSPLCIYGPDRTLTVGTFSWSTTSQQANKHLYFDIAKLNAGAFSTPNCGENIIFLNGIVFANTAELAYCVASASAVANRGLVYFNGETVFDTSAGYALSFDNFAPYGDMSLAIRGTGPVSLMFCNSATRLTATTLESGSKLVMRGRLNTDTLTLAAGATLSLTANVSHVELGASIVKAETATIDFSVPADLPDGVYPVFTGAPGNGFVEPYKSLVTLSGAGRDSVTLTNINGSVAILKGTLPKFETMPDDVSYEWAGTDREADWDVAANWRSNKGDYPWYTKGYQSPYLRGIDTYTITFDNSANPADVNQLRIMNTTGPLTLKGTKTLTFGSNHTASWNDAIACSNRFPTVISSPIKKGGTFAISQHVESYLEYAGTAVAGSDTMTYYPAGDIRVSGTMTCGNGFSMTGISGQPYASSFMILDGGTVTAPYQNTWYAIASGFLTILHGGTVEILDGEYYPGTMTDNKGRLTRYQRVDGTFKMGGLFNLRSDHHYYGSGVFELGGVKTNTEKDFHLGIAGGITFIPTNGWTTVTTNAAAHFAALLVEGDATLGAKRDWRYGVATNVETTATAESGRALRVCEWATLTVDTENPDTGFGQTITLADPIFAYGKLVKKGEGTLLLATTNNVFEGSVTLRGGDIAWETNNAPTFAALAFEGGAIAPAVTDDGAYVPAVVTSDTDVSRLQVTFDGEAPVGWTTVLKASGGARLTGSPWQRHCAVRVVAGADGDECQICKARGFIFYVQ